ncbi:MAG: cupin domain-containing protein, partial [Lentisphaeria bacterium]
PMFGGEGKVLLQHFFNADEMQSANRLCAKLTFAPGCSSGFHIHEKEEEIFLILSGKGEVNDNGIICYVKEGDSILTKSGEGHSIKNIGEEDLVIIAIITCFK